MTVYNNRLSVGRQGNGDLRHQFFLVADWTPRLGVLGAL